MPNNDREVFKNIDYKNTTKPIPQPSRINDIDMDHKFYDNIIETSENGTFDINSINSFTNISQSRDDVYNMLDIMSEDPTIAVALDIYASNVCETNDSGKVMWAESDDPKVLGMINHLLDQLNVDKNLFGWAHSLIKYGDLYLRLLRDSEYNPDIFDEKDKLDLKEEIIIKAYKNNDHFAEYLEMHKNPAEVFDLQRYGKTSGYIRSHIVSRQSNDQISNYSTMYRYNFDQGDIDIFPATGFVHACLEDNSSRKTEEVSISNGEDADKYLYTVKRGQSILYNTFRIWRELSLLENAVLLNRITKSSIVRTVNIEVGDMEKPDVRNLLQRVKSMVEQKAAIGVGKTYEDYTNPGPIENIIYVPTHDGKGNITTSQIGGDVQSDDMKDVEYFKNKVLSSLGIPKQFIGFTEDSAGFNGGSSLTLISSQFAKNIKRIQNALIQAITDAINIILYDKGLTSYINNFTIKMQNPTTQEEKDRRESKTNRLSDIQTTMSILGEVQDQKIKLNILKSLMSEVITNTDVISYIQDEIDRIEATEEEEKAQASGGELGEDNSDMGSEGGLSPSDTLSDMGFDFSGGEVSGGPEMAIENPSSPEPAPEESFYNNKGGDLLNEESLPTWNDLNRSYTDK